MIYILQAGEYIKIGFTDRTIAERLASMQTGCPVRLVVRAMLDGDRSREKALQQQFAAWHYRAEWFRFNAALEDALYRAGIDLTEIDVPVQPAPMHPPSEFEQEVDEVCTKDRVMLAQHRGIVGLGALTESSAPLALARKAPDGWRDVDPLAHIPTRPGVLYAMILATLQRDAENRPGVTWYRIARFDGKAAPVYLPLFKRAA